MHFQSVYNFLGYRCNIFYESSAIFLVFYNVSLLFPIVLLVSSLLFFYFYFFHLFLLVGG